MREAIILAGGMGTRLRQVVSDVPKPMAPIDGRPFLQLLLDRLVEAKFDRVILSVGYMAEKIIGYFGGEYRGLTISYVKEDTPLGTGGAIKKSLVQIKNNYAIVLNGDTYAESDYNALIQVREKTNGIVLGAVQVADARRYGAIVVSNNHLIGFEEKGISGPGLINVGCYVVGKTDLDGFEDGTIFSFETDFLKNVFMSTPIAVYQFSGKFIDIGVPEDYAYAQTYLKSSGCVGHH